MNLMNTKCASRRSAGFSLIEVLMATLILALGLLGLGAVLPVIIRQQSVSIDQSLGTSAMQSAIGQLEGRSSLAPERWKNIIFATQGSEAFWRSQSWYVPPVDVNDASVALFPVAVDLNTPLSILVYGANESLSLGSRVFPTPESGGNEPQFVWDLAMRRDFKGGGMQLAVFVRRIDPFASKGLQDSLFSALLSDRTSTRRLPVSVDTQGRPRLDGSIAGRYSIPLIADVNVYADSGSTDRQLSTDRRRLLEVRRVFDAGDQVNGGVMDMAVAFPLIAQPGQKLVDNLGNVYTVDGSAGLDNQYILRLTRAVASSVPLVQGEQQPPDGVDREAWVQPQYLQQVVFTPQVPVAVQVINKKFDLAPDAVERQLRPTPNPN